MVNNWLVDKVFLTTDLTNRTNLFSNLDLIDTDFVVAFRGSSKCASVPPEGSGPIVRGKETKTVEFGAKCNNILIDGISFIEKLSFNAFNEGTQLKHCVSLSEKLTGVPVKKIGGDQGYSGNDNRTFCKNNGIETSFTQKGRTGKNEVKNATKRELA